MRFPAASWADAGQAARDARRPASQHQSWSLRRSFAPPGPARRSTPQVVGREKLVRDRACFASWCLSLSRCSRSVSPLVAIRSGLGGGVPAVALNIAVASAPSAQLQRYVGISQSGSLVAFHTRSRQRTSPRVMLPHMHLNMGALVQRSSLCFFPVDATTPTMPHRTGSGRGGEGWRPGGLSRRRSRYHFDAANAPAH